MCCRQKLRRIAPDCQTKTIRRHKRQRGTPPPPKAGRHRVPPRTYGRNSGMHNTHAQSLGDGVRRQKPMAHDHSFSPSNCNCLLHMGLDERWIATHDANPSTRTHTPPCRQSASAAAILMQSRTHTHTLSTSLCSCRSISMYNSGMGLIHVSGACGFCHPLH